MSNDRPSPKQYEAWLIQLLRQLFERANFKVEDHKKVGELPLEIDMIVISTGAEKPPNFAELPPLFHYFRQHNVMELKTEKDRLEIADLLKLHAYGWLYMMKESLINVAEITLTALVHHLNPVVLQALPTLGYKQIRKDVYRCDAHVLSHIIVFGDPADAEIPKELQIFSNPSRRQPIIVNELQRGEASPLLEAVLDLYESEVLKLMAIRQETIGRIIETFGREKILSYFRPEDVVTVFRKEDILASLKPEDILASLKPEDILASLKPEDILASLKPEDILASLKQEEMLKRLVAELGRDRLQKMIDEAGKN